MSHLRLLHAAGVVVVMAALAPLNASGAAGAETTLNVPREISVGEEIQETLTVHGASMAFQLTTPTDGTLVVRLSWDMERGRLELDLAPGEVPHCEPSGSADQQWHRKCRHLRR